MTPKDDTSSLSGNMLGFFPLLLPGSWQAVCEEGEEEEHESKGEAVLCKELL